MKAREIMSSDIECCTREDSLQTAARIMRDSDVGAVPVVESKDSMKLVGVITDRDIAIRHVAEGSPQQHKVGDHMSSGRIHTAAPDDDVDSVMKTMRAEQVRRIPVCEGDRLVGIIAQADIATEGVGDSKTGETVQQISEPNGNR